MQERGKYVKDYEINSTTLAILPINNNKSIVYEETEEYIIEKSSNNIIKENCQFYGSSYEGRCVGTKSLTGIKTKYPIIIEESRNIIFFPTSSARTKQSSWIALNKIKTYSKNDDKSKILFKNDKKINLDISYYSLDNQICRATMLKSKLYERKLEEKN